MPLQKQDVNINFAQGLDTKTDPFQVPPGKFLQLKNSVFQKGGLLQKRNGFFRKTVTPSLNYNYITTFKDDLVAIGTGLASYSSSFNDWKVKTQGTPVTLSALPLLNDNLNHATCDAAMAENGLVCTVFIDQAIQIGNNKSFCYQITDSVTGQAITPIIRIEFKEGASNFYNTPLEDAIRVFYLQSTFVIVYTHFDTTISPVRKLKYLKVSLSDIDNETYLGFQVNPPDITGGTLPNLAGYNQCFDGVVLNGTLYLAWQSASGGVLGVTFSTSSLVQSAQVIIDASTTDAQNFSVCADFVTGNNIWVSYDNNIIADILGIQGTNIVNSPNISYQFLDSRVTVGMTVTGDGVPASTTILSINTGTQVVVLSANITVAHPGGTDFTVKNVPTSYLKTCALDASYTKYAGFPKTISGAIRPVNLASNSISGTLYLYHSQADASIIRTTTLYSIVRTTATTASGTITAGFVTKPGMSVAGKGFAYKGKSFLIGTSVGNEQNTYFLLGDTGETVAKLATDDAFKRDYPTATGWEVPSTIVSGDNVFLPYLKRTKLIPFNKNTDTSISNTITTTSNPPNNRSAVFSQFGIFLATFNMAPDSVVSEEIGRNLNISGGYLSAYDGNFVAEQGFFNYPKQPKATWSSGTLFTFTASTFNGSNVLQNISPASIAPNIAVGMIVTGTGVAGLTITRIDYVGATSTIFQLVLSGNATVTSATPATITVTATGNMGPTPDGGQTNNGKAYYAYQITYEYTDFQGNIFRSAPSVPVFVTTTGNGTGTDFKGGTGAVVLNIAYLNNTNKFFKGVKVSIYRWSTGQQTYYEVTDITNPTLNNKNFLEFTYIDTLNDNQIIGNNILYTNGGVIENTSPPATTIMALFDNRLWIVDSEESNLLWYSKPVLQDTPVEMSDLQTFYVSPTAAAQGPTGPITALAAMDDKLVIFKKNAIYYINGTGPDITGTNSQYSEPTFVTTTIGCTNEKSIVFQPAGLMFQSDKGIWLLGRDLSTNYIGAPVEAFNDAVVVSSQNIPGTNQVRFVLNNGVLVMYDYFFGQWGTFENIPALSSTLYQGKHTLLRTKGAAVNTTTLPILQETEGVYIDDNNSAVNMFFQTGWYSLAGLQGYQRAYYFYFLATFLSPHKLTIDISYDYAAGPSQRFTIDPGILFNNYGSETPYGNSSFFGGDSTDEQWRVFFENQKCQAFQISLTETFDPSYVFGPGAGFTMSGINLVVGGKKGYTRVAPAKSTG